MRKLMIGINCLLVALGFSSCQKDLVEYERGDIKVYVEQGDEWLHDFPLFMGIKKKNAPQIAIWAEDMDGNYLETIYVTHKIAAQSWVAAGGNRRKEALPHWSHARGDYKDGVYMKVSEQKSIDGYSGATPPKTQQPLVDGVSGATPQGSFAVNMRPVQSLEKFVVKIEINHSTDFNDHYTKTAKEGGDGYSGGNMGSGQPALVYSADIDMMSGMESFEAELVGHSSPDGSDGNIYADVSKLTTALNIVESITIDIK